MVVSGQLRRFVSMLRLRHMLAGVYLGSIALGCAPATDVESGGVLTADSYSDSQVNVIPASLDFSTSLKSQMLVLEHANGAAFSYEITSEADWLSVQRATGESASGWTWINIEADRSELSPGDHEATLKISTPGESSRHVRVYATVSEEAAVGPFPGNEALAVSTQRLDYGFEMNSLSLLLGVVEGNPVEYTLSANKSWVGFTPDEGYIESGFAQVQVDIRRSYLFEGVNTAILQIETDVGESYEVEIIAWVSTVEGALTPMVEVSQNVLDFGSYSNTQDFTLRNSGLGQIDYHIVAEEGWVAVSPTQGDNNGEIDLITVAVDRAQLEPGSYVCPLSIVANDGLTREIWVLLRELEPEEPTEEELLAWMQELEPLQKVHYSWPFREQGYKYGIDPLLREYVRLSHAATVHMDWLRPQDVDTVVELCKEINDTNPEIPVRMGYVYSPWHVVFPNGYPPTYTGPEHDQEIALMRGLLEDNKAWLAAANANHGTNIEVGAILLDTEQFYRKEVGEPGYEAWNAALNFKYNVMYDLCKEYFPEATVDWYARGEYRRCDCADGYGMSTHFTLDEQGDSYDLSLYRVTEPESMRHAFRLTLAEAQAHGEDRIIPWIALAAGYKRSTEGLDKQYWCADWDYDLYYSWLIGAEVNDPWFGDRPDRFAPWDYAQQVVLFPEPFGRFPHWGKHFIAYVRGANGITELPE